MSPRYQVFVSSTYTDLREERQAVLSALLAMHAIPSGMEIFPASDSDAWELIRDFLADCDYYLLVIGGRYGSVDADGVRYTEREYRLACELEIPVMAFLHSDPDSIEQGLTDKDDELRLRLEAFRTEVSANKHVKYWNTPEDLQGKVAVSYNAFVRRHPATGWVRADALASTEALERLSELRRENDLLLRQLEDQRTSPPPGTDHLATGNDEHIIPVSVAYRIWGEYEHATEDSTLSASQQYDVKVKLTWDDVLIILGPPMLIECSERQLRSELVSGIAENEDLEDLARAVLYDGSWKIDPEYPPALHEFVATVSSLVFEEIKVQLLATGMIQRSSIKHGVNDRNRYWSLTPYGETNLVRLMAIERENAPLAE